MIKEKKKFFPILFLCVMVFLLSACGGGGSGGGTSHMKSWTVMVYMDGDNSLSDVVSLNLSWMEEVGSSSEVNIVTQVDTLDGTTKRYYIERDKDVLLEDLGELDMGDPETLIDFVSWAASKYPAHHYILILWNHGGGFKSRFVPVQRDILSDEHPVDVMTIPALGYALSKITEKLGKKVDIIGMDACLMDMEEVAYQLRNYGDYMVASENTEPYDGWPYNEILSYLVNNPHVTAKTFSVVMVKDYISYYDSSWNATMASVDLSKVGALASYVNELAGKIVSNLDNVTVKQTLQTYIYSKVQRFDSNGDSYIDTNDSYSDLVDFARLLSENDNMTYSIREAAANVISAAGKSIVYDNNTGDEVVNAHGLSIWFPNQTSLGAYVLHYEQLKFVKDYPNWLGFLEGLWN